MNYFVEATTLYRDPAHDPRDDDGLRSERRLFNTADVVLITPTTDGKGRTIFHMRPPFSPPFFVVLEPYEYWADILTTAQPRPVGHFGAGGTARMSDLVDLEASR